VNTDIKVLPAPKGSVSRRCPDITKLKSIGYEKQTSLEEGLNNTFEWYKNHYEWYSKKYTKGVYSNETK
jgi:nucleoside-diphosphate-sugar epimerase